MKAYFLLFLFAAYSSNGDLWAKPMSRSSKAEKAAKKPKKETAIQPEEPAENLTRAEGTTDIKLFAKQVILIDVRTGKVLLERNADQQMTPSSMSKMMTSYLIENKIIKGETSLETTFPVSEKAWRMGGSKTFVPLGESVRLDDLLRGIIIQSGNDACIAAAEGICGSEEAFVQEMNALAKQMELSGTQFMNASGWPQEGHYSTARDLAKLAIHVTQDHPQFYPIYSEKNFTFGKNGKGKPITQGNRNPLLYKELGCDGIKTGHTDDGGYGIVASFTDAGQRYVMVVNGLKSMNERAREATKILHWAKENFVSKQLYTKGAVIEENAPVWLGVKPTIPLLVADDVNLLLPRTEQNKIKIDVHFDSPIAAPIKKGDSVGKVVLTAPSLKYEFSIVAGEDVEKVGFFSRMMRSFTYLLWGKA